MVLKNYNIINEQQLQTQSRTKELPQSVSVDLLQKVDDLANRAKEIINRFHGIYEVAKAEGYPIDKIVEDNVIESSPIRNISLEVQQI
jgi:hypothetical protein